MDLFGVGVQAGQEIPGIPDQAGYDVQRALGISRTQGDNAAGLLLPVRESVEDPLENGVAHARSLQLVDMLGGEHDGRLHRGVPVGGGVDGAPEGFRQNGYAVEGIEVRYEVRFMLEGEHD